MEFLSQDCLQSLEHSSLHILNALVSMASESSFELAKQEIVCRGQIWTVGGWGMILVWVSSKKLMVMSVV